MSIEVGDYWSRSSYGTVVKTGFINGNEEAFEVQNEDGQQWTISKLIVDAEFQFHNKYDKEQEVTKTRMAEIFLSSPRVIMTVNFDKKLKEKDLVKEIKALYPNAGGKLLSKSVYDKSIDSLMGGNHREKRTAIGRHYSNVNELGYCQFIDMEKEKKPGSGHDSRIITIMPGEINWMIVDNVKYVRK